MTVECYLRVIVCYERGMFEKRLARQGSGFAIFRYAFQTEPASYSDLDRVRRDGQNPCDPTSPYITLERMSLNRLSHVESGAVLRNGNATPAVLCGRI